MKISRRLFTHCLTILALLTLGLSLQSCYSPQPTTGDKHSDTQGRTVAWATISNPSSFAREHEPLYVSYYDLGLGEKEKNNSKLAATHNGKAMRQQHIDSNGDGKKDGLLLFLDLPAGARLDIDFSYGNKKQIKPWIKQSQAEISHKVGGKWIDHPNATGKKAYIGGQFKNVNELLPPDYYTDHSNWIRYEGPGIESDKVGYRIYLDSRNGFDIFGKSHPQPALQLVGQDGYESYHHMQDWGMDILKVGDSLGAGGFGVWNGKSVDSISNTLSRKASIIENGHSFSSLQIDYNQWKRQKGDVDLQAQFSMRSGSRLVKTQVKSSAALENFVIGVVKHDETKFVQGSLDIPGDAYTYIGSWGKQSLHGDMLGMAVIFKRRDFVKIENDEKSYVAVMKGQAAELNYYFAAAWQGEHGKGISTPEEFIQYLNRETEKLTYAPRLALKTQISENVKRNKPASDSALYWSKKLADSELQKKTLSYAADGWDVNRKRKPKFEYDIVGLLPMAYHELGKETGDEKYSNVIDIVTASFIQEDGNILRYKESHYNIDSIAPGRAVLRLAQENPHEEKYRSAAKRLRQQLSNHPKTSEGAYWHKKKYPWQLWLDGVYMGMPFLAEYSAMYENGESFEEIVNEFKITRKYLRNDSSGLYYHAWDEKHQQVWANPKNGLSEHFWARGMGWLSMGIVDVLDYIPKEEENLRRPLLNMLLEIAQTLEKYQDAETGTWWQIMDQPNRTANYRESSATAMFSYFLSKSLRLGYLPDRFHPVADKAYNGLINEFVLVHQNGQISMTQQCLVAGLGFGRDGSYDYYMSEDIVKNDPKGSGPFILAGIERYRLGQH